MEAKANGAKRFVRHRAGICLFALLLVGATGSYARDEWFRGLDLEPGLGEASLVLAGRVVDVSETKIMMGGKVETPLIQFKFAPVVGEIAADLALNGGTDYAIEMFSPNRFAQSQVSDRVSNLGGGRGE